MANITNQSPLILDSTGTNIVTGPVWISKIRWVGATVAGHVATINDGGNRVVWTSVAAGPNNVENDTFAGPSYLTVSGDASTGLGLQTLQSGKLYIYLA